MCGIVGVAGHITAKDERAFTQLLVIDQLRGKHSTGVLKVTKHNKKSIDKEVGTPDNLIAKKGIWSDRGIIQDWNKVLLGHNRHATVGEINAENAHPFTHGDIIGVHNGTIPFNNRDRILDHKDFKVDSDNIIYSISEIGLKKTYKTLNGAYALVWYDGDNMNFIRNAERPLFYCHTLDAKAIFWASEPWMLETILDRNSIDYFPVKRFDKNTHYQIKLSNLKTVNVNDQIKMHIASKDLKEGEDYIYPTYHTRSFFGGAHNGSEVIPKDKYLQQSVDVYNLAEDEKDSGYFSGIALDPIKGEEELPIRIYGTPAVKALFKKHGWDGFYRGDIVFKSQTKSGSYVVQATTLVYKEWDDYIYPGALEEEEEEDVNETTKQHAASRQSARGTKEYLNKSGQVISKRKFKQILKGGCCYCSDSDTKNLSEGSWLNDTEVLCNDCRSNDDITNYIEQYYKVH